ncbi:hypothetical protein TNCV_3835641 [Trichonephila clavipes]|nr:hypothetical protein TNCV_3835641 [Trichonephila clavipes]
MAPFFSFERRLIALARELIDRYSSRKRKERSACFLAKKCAVPDDVRLGSEGNHVPKIVSNNRRCRKCSRKGQEKEDPLHVYRMRCPLVDCSVLTHLFSWQIITIKFNFLYDGEWFLGKYSSHP